MKTNLYIKEKSGTIFQLNPEVSLMKSMYAEMPKSIYMMLGTVYSGI